jgi:hypothetical protein
MGIEKKGREHLLRYTGCGNRVSSAVCTSGPVDLKRKFPLAASCPYLSPNHSNWEHLATAMAIPMLSPTN